MQNTTNKAIKTEWTLSMGSKSFGLETDCVAEDKTGLIWLRDSGMSGVGTDYEIQALLLELWESLCSHDLIKQPLPLSSFQSHYPGGNSCYRFMYKTFIHVWLPNLNWRKMQVFAEWPALREKGKGELTNHFSFFLHLGGWFRKSLIDITG